jgi:hypothetical protein
VYVASRGKISKFDPAGNFLMQWNPGGPRPYSIGVGANGNVFASVADENGTKSVIHVFAPDSTPVATWSSASTAGQISGLGHLAFDGCGHVFVASDNRVSIVDENGTWLSEWTSLPTESSPVDQPVVVAVNGFGRAFVVQDRDPRIVEFDLVRSGWVSVAVLGDTAFESNETFTVDLSNPVNAGIFAGSGRGTIVNDDSNIGPNLVANPGFEGTLAGWAPTFNNTLTLSPIAHRGSWAALITAPDSIRSFGLNDSPDAIAAADSDWARYRFSAWVRAAAGSGTARLRVREYRGLEFEGSTQTGSTPIDGNWRHLVVSVLTVFQGSHFDFQVLMDPNAPNAALLVDDVAIERLLGDVPPIVTVPEDVSWGWQRPMQVPVTVRDPDGDAIRSFTADFSNLPGGNDAALAASLDRTTGVFSWEPGVNAARNDPYTALFTASNALTGTDATTIHVSRNLAGNGKFETGTQGWNGNANAIVEQISPGRTGGHAARVTNTAGTVNFGITDSPDWVGSFGAGTVYDYSAWVRSNVDSLPTWLWIREYSPNSSLINNETSEHIPVAGDWVNLRQRYVAHAADSSIDFLVVRGGQVTGDQFEVDDVHISSNTVPTSGVPETVGEAVQALIAPNPMRSEGSLRFALARPGPIRAEVLDVSGRVMRVLANDPAASAGTHVWTLRARDDRGRALSPGVYFYRIRTNDGAHSGRFVVLN